MTDLRLGAVERFYDFHPINAKQILDAVAARGIAPDAITEAVLQQHDQDHYGGTAATDRLITEAAVRAEDVVGRLQWHGWTGTLPCLEDWLRRHRLGPDGQPSRRCHRTHGKRPVKSSSSAGSA